MKKKAFLKCLVALLLFGSNGVVAAWIPLSSLHIVLLRTLLGGLFLLGLFFLRGGRFTFHRKKKSFGFLVLSGVAMGASWMLLYEAYGRIGVGVASLLYYCGPVIVMALSPIFFKEKLTVFKLLGFSLVLVGIFFVNGTAFDGGDFLGILFGLLSAVMYAAMVICNKKATGLVGLENATLQLLVAFFTVAIFTGIQQGYRMELTLSMLFPILFLGIVNTGIGCYCYFSSISRLPVQTVAVCGYLEPLSAVLFSVLFLRETMLSLQIIGAVLMIGSTMVCELVKKKKPA